MSMDVLRKSGFVHYCKDTDVSPTCNMLVRISLTGEPAVIIVKDL